MAWATPDSVNMSSGVDQLISYTNTVTLGWFANMWLISIYIIVLMAYYRSNKDFLGAMGLSGFATFIIALLMWVGGFCSDITFVFSIGILIISVAVMLILRD
jgi:hypothetical protein